MVRDDELILALQTASHALRSFQFGNSAEDFARRVADRCDQVIEGRYEGAMPPPYTIEWDDPLPIEGAPRTGMAFLAIGRHGPNPQRVPAAIVEGDRFWAIVQWDKWRDTGGFVFCLDGAPVWPGVTHFLPLPTIGTDLGS